MINTAVDNYGNNPDWKLVSEKEKTTYFSRKYTNVTKRGCSWRVVSALKALIATLSVYPVIFQRKELTRLWKASYTGFEVQKVRLAIEPPAFAKADTLMNPSSPPRLQEVKPEEVYALQGKIQQSNPKYEVLNLRKLKPELLPVHKIVLGEVTYYFSRPFYLGGEKYGCITLIQLGDKIFSRLSYRSGSQATWRVMPSTQKHNDGERMYIGRFGKGIAETDTQLPIALIYALQDLLPLKTKETFQEAPNLLRTAPDYTSHYLKSVFLKTFCRLREGAVDHFIKGWQIHKRTPDPTAIKLPEGGEPPDFSQPIAPRKVFRDELYEKITASVFASKDRHLQYLFHEVRGKVFLAAIELVEANPINSYGLRKVAFDTKGMDAPLVEYKDQVPAEFEGNDFPRGVPPSWITYISNWNFVRELEIIKLYYKAHKLAIPAKV